MRLVLGLMYACANGLGDYTGWALPWRTVGFEPFQIIGVMAPHSGAGPHPDVDGFGSPSAGFSGR